MQIVNLNEIPNEDLTQDQALQKITANAQAAQTLAARGHNKAAVDAYAICQDLAPYNLTIRLEDNSEIRGAKTAAFLTMASAAEFLSLTLFFKD